MRRVKLTQAMKMEQPYAITGDAGQILHLSNAAALFVITLKNGDYVDQEPYPKFTRAQLEQQEETLITESNTLKPVGDGSKDEPVKAPKMPYGNAPKAAWIRYARAVDPSLTPERAEGMTKADLMSRYGERL